MFFKTFSAKASDKAPQWWVVDAQNRVLGDVAVQVANLLRGKNKPTFTSHMDTGDYVVVINAKDIRLSGKKETDKVYTWFSGYLGGLKSTNPKQLRAKYPERILEKAIKGMIPHNRLGRAIGRKLKVYAGSEHPHAAQEPKNYELA